jgi:3-methyladenine DNA glycosylase AlkD
MPPLHTPCPVQRLTAFIQDALQKKTDDVCKNVMSKYMKGVIPCRGIRMPEIKAIVTAAHAGVRKRRVQNRHAATCSCSQ